MFDGLAGCSCCCCSGAPACRLPSGEREGLALAAAAAALSVLPGAWNQESARRGSAAPEGPWNLKSPSIAAVYWQGQGVRCGAGVRLACSVAHSCGRGGGALGPRQGSLGAINP
jgi:hypothetical protein